MMLRIHAAKFGLQWDQYLSGVLWAYRNTPHSSTGEKPSFLLYGFDCRTPTEAALLPPKPLKAANVSDYREQMMLTLSSARSLAKEVNRGSQRRYKAQHDRSARDFKIRVGDWVLVYFAQDETGKTRKLSQPWHGPYRVISRKDPDIVASKIYFPDDPPIQIHQSRVQFCPTSFPTNFYWYGNKRAKPGRPSKKVMKHLRGRLNWNTFVQLTGLIMLNLIMLKLITLKMNCQSKPIRHLHKLINAPIFYEARENLKKLGSSLLMGEMM